MSDNTEQAKFEGWAVVDVMGHQRHIGFVTTEAYGQAVLFRIDTPDIPEREFVLTAPEYATPNGAESMQWCPQGTRVKRAAAPAHSVLIGAASIYSMTPCSEDLARKAIEKSQKRPLILLELPPQAVAMIENRSEEDDDEDREDEDDSDF